MSTVEAMTSFDDLDCATALALLERMMVIRRAEERLARECAQGSISGAVHLYIGQEAVAVGACSLLSDPNPDDPLMHEIVRYAAADRWQGTAGRRWGRPDSRPR